MGDVTVGEAIEKLRSDRLKERHEGFADLRLILSQSRKGERLHLLNDKAFHKIYEALFHAIATERSVWAKSSKANVKSQAAARLAASSAILRLAVESGVRKLKQRSVKALIDHITQTLPLPGAAAGFCEPLSLDYLKSLRALLDHPAHVEHLAANDWSALVHFTAEAIHLHQAPSSDDLLSLTHRPSLPAAASNGTSSSASTSQASSEAGPHARIILEGFLACLRQLLLAPRRPLAEHAAVLTANLLRCLRSPAVGHALQSALACLNIILLDIAPQDLPLTEELVPQLMPLLRRLWNTRSTSLRDEILVTVILLQDFLERMLQHGRSIELATDLDALLDTLRADYLKRPDRDWLLLDDLSLIALAKPRSPFAHPFELPTLSFQGTPKAEQAWAILQVMAVIAIHLDSRRSDHDILPKRRKRSRLHDDLVRRLHHTDAPSMLCALQIIPFVLSRTLWDLQDVRALVLQLVPLAQNDSALLANWSMLALAVALHQEVARHQSLETEWNRVWQLALRAASSPASCRVACHLLETLLRRGRVNSDCMKSVIDASFSSADARGPNMLTGTALSFWTAWLEGLRFDNPSLAADAVGYVKRWLLAHWHPARFADRSPSMAYPYVSAGVLLDLMASCVGSKPTNTTTNPCAGYGRIAQAWRSHLERQSLLRYLLLLDPLDPSPIGASRVDHSTADQEGQQGRESAQIQAELLGFCSTEFHAVARLWKSTSGDARQQTAPDSVRTLASFCIIGHHLCATVSASPDATSDAVDDPPARGLREATVAIVDLLVSLMATDQTDSSSFDAVLEVVYPFIPDLTSSNRSAPSTEAAFPLQALLRRISPALEAHRQRLQDLAHPDSADAMDLDDDFESQLSRHGPAASDLDLARDEASARASPAAFREAATLSIYRLSSACSFEALADHLTSLPLEHLLACQGFLGSLIRTDDAGDRAAADRLLVHLGDQYLQKYEYERCEIAQSLCLEAMTATVELWSSENSDELTESSASLYEWFVEVALENDLVGSRTMTGLADLLLALLRLKPEYGRRSSSASSVRTSLLKIMRDGDVPVKFHVSERIADMFGFLDLRQHEAIFEEVLSSLPRQADWRAGIAVRLLTLARLAASWYTLLRRCVYHIFETPASIPEATGHASRCLADVSRTLQLSSPTALFRLFLPQIMYTWLESQALLAMPFTPCGYADQLGFLRDVQQEATAQLIMRCDDAQMVSLAGQLGISPEELIAQSFDRVMAYSLARDISLPPIGDPSHYVGGEVRVRKRLGTERFVLLLQPHFSSILALFFCCLDQEAQFVRACAKQPRFQYASDTLKAIMAISSSDVALPANQQPSFRARYLLDEILHLCRRTKHDPTEIWTPALNCLVLRSLLDTIHPALGSLHSCTVISRIRILVCIAGASVLEAYPLEMLLHSLHPFLADAHCAEDTIGLLQYLLEAGARYLAQVPTFVIGSGLAILASLRDLLNPSGQVRACDRPSARTKTRARIFWDWLRTYLTSYDSPHLSGESEALFRTLVEAALGYQGNGKAVRGTPESSLLQALLDDARGKIKLLTRPAQELTFSMVAAHFELAPSYREDILGSDEASTENAMAAWRSCHQAPVGEGYLVWVGRVLGRMFAATGEVPAEMLPECELASSWLRSNEGSDGRSIDARSIILKKLCHLLQSDRRSDVGLAESTLQAIVAAMVDPQAFSECVEVLPPSLLSSLQDRSMQAPSSRLEWPPRRSLDQVMRYRVDVPAEAWARDVCVALAYVASDDAIVGSLPPILARISGLAEQLFPLILYIVLLRQIDRSGTVREEISSHFGDWLRSTDDETVPHVRMLLTALLYLRTQAVPRETSQAEREHWLEVRYGEAARAAVRCRLFKTALLLVEIEASEAARASRRSSTRYVEPSDLLLEIYRNVDDPDSYYGVQRAAGLASIMARLEYEKEGFKNLTFRGAHDDVRLRKLGRPSDDGPRESIKALRHLDLNALSLSLLRRPKAGLSDVESGEDLYRSALRLGQWDVPVSSTQTGEAATVYRSLQLINNTMDDRQLRANLDEGIGSVMRQLMKVGETGSSVQTLLRALAVLAETDEVLTAEDPKQMQETWGRMVARQDWMATGRYEDVSQVLAVRDAVFGSLRRRPHLQAMTGTMEREAQELEIRSVLNSSRISRKHGTLQASLNAASYVASLEDRARELGIKASAAAQMEVADVLWDQGEMTASIRVLQEINQNVVLASESIHVGRSELLAKIGHRVSEARLEKPEAIIAHYLLPAIKELRGVSEGEEAGQVFHEFASFCDRQLQDADNLEDYRRVEGLRERKAAEVRDLEKMYRAAGSQNKTHLQVHRNRAKQWFELDDREFQRLREGRQAFLRQSLENYLLCLKACETYDHDALRFCALWLAESDSALANEAVSRYLKEVPSRKFASLINQLCSRLLDRADAFQKQLFPLILRICVEHPYHGMYQIFSTSKSKGKDAMSSSRFAAASRMVGVLRRDESSSRHWIAVHNTSVCYAKLAAEKMDEKVKAGSRVGLHKSQAGQRLEQEVVSCKIPPPTMKVEVRADGDYSGVPVVSSFQAEFTMASGVSAPKIVTAVGSNGVKYKQLVKGGNDDLRQDAIMEQVFERVSQLLQGDRSTRQRKLRIRTYKVLPLTTNAGIIEFVPNTMPLHDFLMPAHQKYFPRDWKTQACRKAIMEVQTKTVEARLKRYREVTEHFHPVMRYFFTERFDSATEWFERRLAYGRSTAAISILGHVLGLGDRHGHNILLDEETGEVVHIDLGVAFEQGRVLPVPEVVPFRLTRDVVDGMGITKTEGVFRRCCEFTLEALRKEAYSIMTILDVLRYDPLYSWTVSPLRAKRQLGSAIGEEGEGPEGGRRRSSGRSRGVSEDEDEGGEVEEDEGGEGRGTRQGREREKEKEKEKNDEPSEAERALTIVAKKLSKTLSVTATVNELIQQAADERNLALLYCGWAAYA